MAGLAGEDLTAVIKEEQSPLAEPLPPRILECAEFTFLGSGMSVGLANEAALEAARGLRETIWVSLGQPGWLETGSCQGETHPDIDALISRMLRRRST